MKRVFSCVGAVGLAATAITSSAQGPLQAVAIDQPTTVLPRNTPVSLVLNETLNTKQRKNRQGASFALTVDQAVRLGRYIVIPRGSRAIGTIIDRTGKGAFGKSGKMEISLDYIEVGDTRIPIEGRHREEGEGNATATIATFMFISMLGSGLITGHSAEILSGRRFTVWTKEDTPVQLPEAAMEAEGAPAATSSSPAVVVPATAPPGVLAATLIPGTRPRAPAPTPATDFGNGRLKCVTCR